MGTHDEHCFNDVIIHRNVINYNKLVNYYRNYINPKEKSKSKAYLPWFWGWLAR